MKRLLQFTILTYSICLLAVSAMAEGNTNSLLLNDRETQGVALSVTIDVGDATCVGASNGILMANPDGGLPPYTYLWTPGGATTQMLTGVAVGTYTVVVTDNAGATATATATVGESSPLDVVLAATYETAPGCEDGKVDVVKSQLGDTGPYTYVWSNGSTNFQITDLPAGIYCVTVTNAFGCTGNGCIELQLLNSGITATTTSTNVSCDGGSDGTGTVTAMGGSAYTYQWDDPLMQTTATATGLAAGTYHVTVDGVGGCAIVDSVIITEPPAITIQAAVVDEDCTLSNGSITLTVGGGTPGYTYNWSDPTIGNTANATNLSAGNYSVTVTDANGCTAVVPNAPIIVKDNCPPPPSCTNPVLVSVVVFEATCGNSDGSATINVAGGPGGFTYAWTPNVSTTNSANNLPAGTYSVLIADASDATCNITETFTVGVIDGPVVTILSTTPATCRETNGTAVLGPIGLTYEWCNGYVGYNPINLAAGECQVTITDPSTGCVDVIEVVIDEFNPLTATPTVNQQPDCNATNGSVTINVSGGSFIYVYDWSDGGTGATRTDLGPGAYCVTVTDNGPTGCVTTTCFVLSPAGGPVVAVTSPVILTCPGSADGTVVYTITPDNPNYTVVITDGAGVVQTNGSLIAGTYCLAVSDPSGCVIGGDCFDVISPSQIDVDVDVINKDCASGGTINLVDVQGGNGGFTYSWVGPGNFTAITRNISGLEEGSYSVTITDSKGCNVIITGIALEDDCTCQPPVVSSVVVVEAHCGFSDGKATVNIAGGNISDYNFNWTPSVSNGHQAINIPPGIYSVMIQDKTDATCFINETFTVGATGGFDDVQVDKINASCNAADGQVMLTPTTYQYLWDDGFTGDSRSDLIAGTYFVQITDPTDPASCIDFITINLEEDNLLNIQTVIDQKPTCNSANGTVTLIVTGGNNYTYSWSSNAATQTNLAAGIYTVVVTDNVTGCSKAITFGLDEDVPSASLIIDPIVLTSCTGMNDAMVDLVTSLTTDPGFVGTPDIKIEDALGNVYTSGDIPPGNYCAVIRDGNGCIAGTECFEVKYPNQIDIDIAILDKDCVNEGSITIVEVIGGTGPGTYNFDWLDINPSTNDPKDRLNIPAGMYPLILTDGNSCQVAETINVDDNSSIVSATVNSENPNCFGDSTGMISITPAGGMGTYIYTWDGGVYPDTSMLDSLAEGSYSVTITDAAGCSTTVGPINLMPNSNIQLTSTPTNNNCFGDSTGMVSITPSGGMGVYTYDWDGMYPDTSMLDNLPEGSYSVTVTDEAGCTSTAGPIVLMPNSNIQLMSVPNNVSCDGSDDGSITVTPSGGVGNYTYDWDGMFPNTPTLNNLPIGQYSVTVTDDAGCTAIGGVYDLIADDNLEIQLTPDTTACSADMLTLNVLVMSGQAVDTIIWSSGGVVIGDTDTLDVQVSDTVDYIVEVISGNCMTTDTITVTEFILEPTVTPEAEACKGAPAQLNPGGSTDYVYSWMPADQLEDATVASPEILETSLGGIFTVTIYDPAKPECTVERMVELTVNDLPSLEIDGDSIACAPGEELDLIASSNTGTSFIWADNPAFDNAQAGATYNGTSGQPGEETIYYVQVTDDLTGCTSENSIGLDNFSIRLTLGEPVDVCEGVSVEMTPIFTLSQGETLVDWVWTADNATIDATVPDAPIIDITSSTTVIVDVVNNFGCTLTDSVEFNLIEIGDGVIATATPDTILRGQTSDLNVVGDEGYSYLWSPSESLSADDIIDPVASPLETTTYTVEIETPEGCTTERSVEVVVINDCASNLFFPNAFTPNRDGKNDVLYLRGAFVEELYFAIYNRWGEKVFESNNINDGWDGTYKGKQLSPDVFGYYLEVTCIDGEEYRDQGNVSLLR